MKTIPPMKIKLIMLVAGYVLLSILVYWLNHRMVQLESQVAQLQDEHPTLFDNSLQDLWEQDRESDLSTFLSVMMAKDIKVGDRTIATLMPDRRLQLCRFLLDWQAKQRTDNRRKADPNNFCFYLDNDWATYMIYLDEDVARQSGLDFLKLFDPNEATDPNHIDWGDDILYKIPATLGDANSLDVNIHGDVLKLTYDGQHKVIKSSRNAQDTVRLLYLGIVTIPPMYNALPEDLWGSVGIEFARETTKTERSAIDPNIWMIQGPEWRPHKPEDCPGLQIKYRMEPGEYTCQVCGRKFEYGAKLIDPNEL